MALNSDHFKAFLAENSKCITGNLNLTDLLLFNLKTNYYIEELDYEDMLIEKATKRRAIFFNNILTGNPEDYMTLNKTRLLIKLLENKDHPRNSVRDVFQRWEDKLLESQAGATSLAIQQRPQQEIQHVAAYGGNSSVSSPGFVEAPGPSSKASSVSVKSDLKKTSETTKPPSGENKTWEQASSTRGPSISIRDNYGNLFINQTWTNVNSTYIESSILNGRLGWAVDGKEISTAGDVTKLIGGFEVEKQSAGTGAFQKGQVLYLNWRYDRERTVLERLATWRITEDAYDKLKLESAIIDEPEVKRHFQHLTNCDEKGIFFRANLSTEGLQDAIDLFKDQINPDLDYIVVILNAHGCNRTRLLTDNLKTIDIFNAIVRELDHSRFQKLGQDKPRIYLVNACQGFHKGHAVAAARENIGSVHSIMSPYFVFCATLPDETAWANKKDGSAFFRAIYDGGFRKNMTMYDMIAEVQSKVDAYTSAMGVTQTTSVWQSSKFKTNVFAFGDPKAASTESGN